MRAVNTFENEFFGKLDKGISKDKILALAGRTNAL